MIFASKCDTHVILLLDKCYIYKSNTKVLLLYYVILSWHKCDKDLVQNWHKGYRNLTMFKKIKECDTIW